MEKCESVELAKTKIIKSGLATPETVIGCKDDEISTIELTLKRRIPSCYARFLRLMGRSAGQFLVGTDYSYPKMLRFRAAAENLLQDTRSSFRLPEGAIVFLLHQGHTFLYLEEAGDHDDPPVAMFSESTGEPARVSDSFTAWLVAAVADDIAMSQELGDIP